eukprot:COSAG04_NODE_7615_length_1097_cov_1.385772_1_plen_189_part_00
MIKKSFLSPAQLSKLTGTPHRAAAGAVSGEDPKPLEPADGAEQLAPADAIGESPARGADKLARIAVSSRSPAGVAGARLPLLLVCSLHLGSAALSPPCSVSRGCARSYAAWWPVGHSLHSSRAFAAERGAPVGGPLSRAHRRPWRSYLNGLCRYGSNLTLAVSALAAISATMTANASSSQLGGHEVMQ